MLTLVASALAGGDCIDDADALRAGRTSSVLGCMAKAPSTLGTFLRSFRWGHVRQLDRVSRELLARAWAAGGGPGDGPLTIDLDSTICETYGLAKEGAVAIVRENFCLPISRPFGIRPQLQIGRFQLVCQDSCYFCRPVASAENVAEILALIPPQPRLIPPSRSVPTQVHQMWSRPASWP